MNIYTLKDDPVIMGEEDPKFGYTFWGKVNETVKPIMFNSKNGNVLGGQTLVAEKVTDKTSGKGIDYLRLGGVKISGSQGNKSLQDFPTFATNEPKSPAAADKAYLRDATTIPLDVYRVRANINGLPTNSTERAEFFEHVREDSEELLNLIDKVRNPGLGAQFKKLQSNKEEDLLEGLEEQ